MSEEVDKIFPLPTKDDKGYQECYSCKTIFLCISDCKDIPKEKILCDGCYNESIGRPRWDY